MSWLGRLFKPRVADLRGAALTWDAAKFGIRPTPDLPRVWAALTDMGYPNGWASLLSAADGSTSLYTSGGGGIIGGGPIERVASASRRLLALMEADLDGFAPTNDFTPPGNGVVRFIVFTYDGKRAAAATADALASGQHPLSPIWGAADEVITQLRLVEEAAAR